VRNLHTGVNQEYASQGFRETPCSAREPPLNESLHPIPLQIVRKYSARKKLHGGDELNDDTGVSLGSPRRDKIMDKDRIKGSAQQAKGAIKEAAGKAIGDAKLEAEGKTDKAAGKVQNAVGGLKDALRGK
jgi:uncharacterized protein YjbJ (UPF0337 family)